MTAGPPDASLRVLLADDETLARAGFRMVLDNDDGLEVVAEAGDGDEAVRLIHRHRPEVVLMDIRMPRVDGVEAIRRSGFLVKDVDPDALRRAVRVVAAGEALSNGEIGEELVISPATAKTHVSHAMTKLDARDRAQLVVIAFETGLASPSSRYRRDADVRCPRRRMAASRGATVARTRRRRITSCSRRGRGRCCVASSSLQPRTSMDPLHIPAVVAVS